MSRTQREIPWLDKRNGVYNVFWYDSAKRRTARHGLRTTDPEEAQKRYAAFLAVGKIKNIPLTVPAALDQYYSEHLSKRAIDPLNAQISIRHLKHFFEDTLLKDIGVPECRAYAEHRATDTRPVKMSTVGRELTVLKAASRHAVRWKRLSLTDMPTFEMPKIAKSKGVWLLEEELQLLRRTARSMTGELIPGRTAAFIDLCYYTGSRRGAIEGLTWGQVDLERNRINLAKPGEPITRKRRPVVAIDPKLKPTLVKLKENRINQYVLGSPGRMCTQFDNAAEKAGVLNLIEKDGRPAARLTPHMLRHTRATHLLQAGKSLWAVANLLGDSMKTLEEVYGHHNPLHSESLFDAAAEIEYMLS